MERTPQTQATPGEGSEREQGMKATLTFTIPDEQADFTAAINGRKALPALWEIDQRLRSLLKHGEPSMAEAELAKDVRAMIPSELLDL